MGIFSRLEAFIQRLFEAPAGRLGASLQPVSLEKRIERAMDTNRSYRDDGVLVPNEYTLHLNPADFETFASYRGSLEDDLAHRVLSRARHERYTLVARPRVQILSDSIGPAAGRPRGGERHRRRGCPHPRRQARAGVVRHGRLRQARQLTRRPPTPPSAPTCW